VSQKNTQQKPLYNTRCVIDDTVMSNNATLLVGMALLNTSTITRTTILWPFFQDMMDEVIQKKTNQFSTLMPSGWLTSSVISKFCHLPATSVINLPWSVAAEFIALGGQIVHSTQWSQILANNCDFCLPHLHSMPP